MTDQSAFTTGNSSLVWNWLISRLLAAIGNPPIRIALWNGQQGVPAGRTPIGTVVIKEPSALLKMLLDPEFGFGECYSGGQVEIQGNLLDLLLATYRALEGRASVSGRENIISKCLRWTRKNTLRESRENIHHHYDIGTDFYRLWLDAQLLYTCAYFTSPAITLEEAQVAKMDHLCRKIRLRPGDNVVEAGCGWGALAMHMAKHYGARVKAFNISREQIRYARERAGLEGLSGQVEFIEEDYRDIKGKYDVFVSVGMLEHVGLRHYKELGQVMDRCLTSSGRGFLHFIGRNRPSPLNSWTRKRIFPGAYPPALREVMDVFEGQDFSVLDVENLRLHYARTLECWLERFEKSAGHIEEMLGSNFVRAWRLYLTGSIASFLAGSMQLFQIIFTRGGNNDIPRTRAYIYADQREEQEDQWIPATS